MPLILVYILTLLPHPKLVPHPFFVSVTEIEYLQKEKILGVSCKVFNDDLETALKNASGAPVDIFKGDKTKNNAYLQQYFAKHFTVQTDGSPTALRVIGYEIDGEACFVYLEASLAKRPKQVKVTTDLMYDLNKSQINMIHCLDQGNRQSQKLTYPNREVLFTFK
jgi:hypothetical protein